MAEYAWANWVLWGGVALVLAALIGGLLSRKGSPRHDQWPVDHSGTEYSAAEMNELTVRDPRDERDLDRQDIA